MAEKSNIAWTDSSWNPVRGCERVSEGCRKCYAEVLAARHSYAGGWGEGLAQWVERPNGVKEARWTGVIRTVGEMLDAPLRWRKPRRVFVNSMSDLFHQDVPEAFIDKVYAVMAMAPRHTFQILTKRPERMLAYLEQVSDEKDMQRWINAAADMNAPGDCIGYLEREVDWPLENVWHGVSAEDQDTFDERVEILGQVPSAVRFVSAEPLLGSIDVGNAFDDAPDGSQYQPIDWIIVGAESGQDHRPMDIDAARWLIRQCKLARKAVFVKQDNGPRPGMQGRFTAEEWALKEYPEARQVA